MVKGKFGLISKSLKILWKWLQILRWKLGWKVRMRVTGAQPETGADQVSWNRGTSINTTCTKYKRRTPQEKNFVFFLQNTLETAFQMRIDAHKQGNFFQNQGTFCLFSKETGETSLLSPASSAPKLIYFLKRGWYSTSFFFMAISKFSKISFSTLKSTSSHGCHIGLIDNNRYRYRTWAYQNNFPCS